MDDVQYARSATKRLSGIGILRKNTESGTVVVKSHPSIVRGLGGICLVQKFLQNTRLAQLSPLLLGLGGWSANHARRVGRLMRKRIMKIMRDRWMLYGCAASVTMHSICLTSENRSDEEETHRQGREPTSVCEATAFRDEGGWSL